jgi:three-Cys-motif partner protein
MHEDGNRVLEEVVVPKLQYRERRRGFVLLDPYGLQLEWEVVKKLGKTRSADVAINFPTMDINRNSALRDQASIAEANATRMTKWWGDESWKEQFYGPGPKLLHGESTNRKTVNNDDVVEMYRQRLLSEGGYEFVTNPLPMKNSQNAVLYYILLASNNETAVRIMDEILDRYRKPRTLSLPF